jgi:hypothetical protein
MGFFGGKGTVLGQNFSSHGFDFGTGKLEELKLKKSKHLLFY